jgi:hypothetical protein
MTPTSGLDFPSAAEIAEIVAITDAVLRNLRITDAYFRLNRAMGVALGPENLSWCGFATWASKTAGEFIRQDEVPALIEDWIGGAMARAGAAVPLARFSNFDPLAFLRDFAQTVIDSVSAAIGTGNQEVFADVAPPFSTFLTLWTSHQGAIPDSDKQAFLDSLHGGDPPDDMFNAFSATFLAGQAAGSPEVAQSLGYSNALIGCVEQTRVQPYIQQSMNAPVADLFLQHLDAHLSGIWADALKELLKPLAAELEKGFQDLSTEWLMKLTLPDGALRLGENVPPLNGKMYPDDLAQLNAPQPLGVYSSLNALDAAASAAQDWVDYNQRMRYIAILFRSRQQDQNLREAPFSETQVAAIDAGQIPPGPL